jgi:hypothetical protein
MSELTARFDLPLGPVGPRRLRVVVAVPGPDRGWSCIRIQVNDGRLPAFLVRG